MKFKINRSKFLETIKSVQNVVANKGTLAILQNVLLQGEGDTLMLTTTDLELSTKAMVTCEIIEKGETTLPVKLLFNLIGKVAEGDVEIEVDSNDQAVIKAGNTRYKLNGKRAADFPKLPNDENACEYNLEANVLQEMLRKTHYSASQDDTRRSLKGVLMSFKSGKLTMVATDGRRLAMVEKEIEFPASNENDIVLPTKTVQEIMRTLGNVGNVKIEVQKSRIGFKLGTVEIYSKLLEEVYPNYTQVIPKECRETITVDRQLLFNALERASVMTMDEAHSTRLIFEADNLLVTSAASEVGEAKDEMPIKYAGEKIEIVFNPTYIMECLKAIDDDEVTISLNNGHTPAVIRCQIPFLYVIMPLRTT